MDALLGDDLRQAARDARELRQAIAAREQDALADSVGNALRDREEQAEHAERPQGPSEALVGACATAQTPALFQGRGLSKEALVPEVGLEPTSPQGQSILSRSRMPIPPLRRGANHRPDTRRASGISER